ncbi:hypothetical protein CDD83_2148 [Cordyceps sp. RAO-2017]|nr:hypothetical protein CDD83_2148 [Cordyceps sp. RAO-2017]
MSDSTSSTAAVTKTSSGLIKPRPTLAAAIDDAGLRVLRLWSAEIASLVAAAGLVAAIVIILARYDGHELPNWPYSINLNTVIALLTLCLRAALVIVAAEVIGQSKWTWFSDGATRPLANFQTFDEASRGLLGSFKLLGLLRLSFRGSPLAVAAAVTTILSLAISPFSQQAIKTVPCGRVSSADGAKIPVALEIPGSDGSFANGITQSKYSLGPKVRGALLSGITNPGGNDSAVQPGCASGNCTFPEPFGVPHSTIGLCAQCMDTSPLLRFTRQTDPKALPPNVDSVNLTLGEIEMSLGIQRPLLVVRPSNMSFAESIMTPEFRETAGHACSNISVLSWSSLKGPVCTDTSYRPECVMATSCAIYPCMKDIKVGVSGGRLEDHVVRTTPARPNSRSVRNSPFPNLYAVKSPCVVEGRLYDATNFSLVPVDPNKRKFVMVPVDGKDVDVPSDCLYAVNGDYWYGLGSFLSRELLFGVCRDTMNGREHIVCNQTWWLYPFYNSGKASFDSINGVFQDMATATTNFFRTDGWGPVHNSTVYKERNDSSLFKLFLRGQVHESTICMRLEWPWLLLPAILCLTTIALLIAMLIFNVRNSHQPVWKSSTLPLLFFGLDTLEPDEGAHADDLEHLDRQAKKMRATLDLDSPLARAALVNLDEPDS